MGRQLSAEQARRAALELWLRQVVARPQLWCDELRAFLGMPPPTSRRPPRAAPSAARQSALGRTSPDAELGELRRIHAKMRARVGLKLEAAASPGARTSSSGSSAGARRVARAGGDARRSGATLPACWPPAERATGPLSTAPRGTGWRRRTLTLGKLAERD